MGHSIIPPANEGKPLLTLALGLCFGVGVSLGMLGASGSILSVPILVYVAGYAPRTAIPMSLALVGATSLVSAALHWRRGNVEIKTALLFALFGAGGAFTGSRLTGMVSDRTLMILFAALMLVAGWRMWARSQGLNPDPAEQGRRYGRVPLLGFGVGTMTGFLGIGGGFLALPALVLLVGVPMRLAVGTTLAVVFLNSISGLLSHLPRATVPLDWTFYFVFSAAAGGVLGQRLSLKAKPESLQKAFAVLVCLLGLFVGVRNLAP